MLVVQVLETCWLGVCSLFIGSVKRHVDALLVSCVNCEAWNSGEGVILAYSYNIQLVTIA